MTRAALIAALALAAGLSACRQPEPAEPAPQPAAPAAAAPVAPEPALAVDVADPKIAAEAFRAAWNASGAVQRKVTSQGPARIVAYEEGGLIPLGGDRYALISSGNLEDAAHVDSGALAIHYLKRTPTGFERTGAWPEFVWDGSFGNAPSWEPRSDLTTAPAILTTGGGTWQGYTCQWSSLIELTDQGPLVRTASFPTGYSNGGAALDPKDEQEMSATVVADQKGRSFTVRYSGDRTASVPYSLKAGRFVATSEPDLLTC